MEPLLPAKLTPKTYSKNVVAEIFPALNDEGLFDTFLQDWHLEFIPASRQAAQLAGSHFARYLGRGGKKGRIVADFLVGAHAQIHAERLLARDRGYLRDYFADLPLLDPTKLAQA